MRAEDLDITTLLSADAEAGALHFAGLRALIVDAGALGALRRDVVDALGVAGGRSLLTRFGYVQGWRAAEALRGRFASASAHAMRDAGGRLGVLQGMLRIAPGTGPMTPEGATVAASYEAEQHLQHCGRADAPVCWTLAGFASGYLSCVERRDIVVLEDRCVACGDRSCRFVARPREAWGETLTPHAAYLPPAGPPRSERAAVTLEDELQSRSPAIQRTLELARRVAAVDSSVLLLGDSGTGKDRLARFIHARSRRAAAPFLAVHCGAIPEPLLESELFGHARGAFTGATRDRVGMLEAAGAGTLFLDEVGEMSPAMQVKLLRALQQRELRRVGENHPRPLHARIVAATHRDLAAAVEQGGFRRDLYYRLRVVELRLPPLRARQEDILPLARALLASACARVGRSEMSLGTAACERLLHHSWPGNVRELENAMERAAALAAGPQVEADDLPDDIAAAPVKRTGSLQQLEHAAIVEALGRHGGHQQRAAAELGISPSTLYRRLRKQRA
ncbi:sigma-54-dependent Fis family transcriptional regulator [Nannocystis pusilla]|uniref:Sigma-54-dependent Fis family transcriptional regulator n=1 Tax=Nannocystis pusilla TaxID=889268 RepID=A0ABS7TKK1_9BACT|nr:sigma-54-dependent Fis family transcriptional regulator [Nannocystis pusilla]MBZ5708746.1 sigma-54-dependent Fis family transcriptional regulator [Nannocystis pusilla]